MSLSLYSRPHFVAESYIGEILWSSDVYRVMLTWRESVLLGTYVPVANPSGARSRMVESSIELAAKLISLVEEDDGLPAEVREQASRLRGLADRNPDLAIDRLKQEARRLAAELSYRPPSIPLSKSLSLETFYAHYLVEDVKARFTTAESYRRYLERQSDINHVLRDQVKKEGILVPAKHSWLAPYEEVRDRTADELIVVLEVPDTRPPLVVLVFGTPGDTANEFLIRTPRATDAVLGEHTRWRPGGPASGVPEFVDQDIPASALRQVEWRP